MAGLDLFRYDATELVSVGEADWTANTDVQPNHTPFCLLPGRLWRPGRRRKGKLFVARRF